MNKAKYEKLLRAAQDKNIIEWIYQNNIVNERGDPIEFHDHYFLYDIYNDWTPEQAILKAAQVGFSTAAILKTLYAAKVKGFNVIYTLPTRGDVHQFVPEKVNQIISANPVLQEWVKDKDSVQQKQIGDRFVYYRGTFTGKEALMFSSDLNIYDEEDRSNPDVIDQYASRLDYSKYKGQWHFSNPSFPKAGTHKYWVKSDQKHWFITCEHCNHRQYMSWPESVDYDREVYICKKCGRELSDETRRVGEWVKKWQDREVSGYWINQMMTPWKTAKELIDLEATKSRDYFYNFVLGLPYKGSDVVVDKDLILRNIVTRPSSMENVCIGVDVGLTKHVVVGTQYGIAKMFTTKKWDVIENIRNKYDATMVIDALPDLTRPRELVQEYRGKVFINYYKEGMKSNKPIDFKKKDKYGIVESDRTRMIELAISKLSKGEIMFHMRPEELEEYIDHWEKMYRVEQEDRMGNPKVRWESADDDDHWCFVGNTQIKTREGDKNIKDVKEGEFVLTRDGYKEVERSWLTRESAKTIKLLLSNGSYIQATPDHKIYVDNELNPLHSTVYGGKVTSWKKLSLTESSLEDTQNQRQGLKGFITHQMELIGKMGLVGYIKRFGNIIMGRYLKDMLYTIKTATLLIMTPKTLSVSLCQSTGQDIWKKDTKIKSMWKRTKHTLIELGKSLMSGGKQKRERSGTQNMLIIPLSSKNQKPLSALNVTERAKLGLGMVASSVLANVVVVGMQESGEKDSVYNLTVKDNHEYFANNILVGNCHATSYYLIAAEKASIGQGATIREPTKGKYGRETFEVKDGQISAISREEFEGKPDRDWRYI